VPRRPKKPIGLPGSFADQFAVEQFAGCRIIAPVVIFGVLNPLDVELYLRQPWLLILFAFQLWMFVDAIRRQEWFWAVFIFLFPVLNAVLYFFLVYRAQPSATRGFELPGAYKRSRIKDLQARIHHLDKAHHHAELGDIYFQQGNLAEAEKCYRAAIERDNTDPDFQAHLGQCLLRKGEASEAATLLESVVRVNPQHDYGHSQMAYAEALTRLNRKDEALAVWQKVLENHGYARARVQLSELYIERGQTELARKELSDLLADETHAPAFQKHRDKIWLKRAKALLKEIS
jgi:hypothetical protein